MGTSNYVDLNYNRCALFWPDNPIHVLQSTASPSVTFVVFARFVEPELAGHIDGTDDYYGQSSFLPMAAAALKGASEVSQMVDDPIDYFSRRTPQAFRDVVLPMVSLMVPSLASSS